MKKISLLKRFTFVAGLGATFIFGSVGTSGAALIAHFKFDEGAGTTAGNLVDSSSPATFSPTGASWTTDVSENFLVSSAYHNNGADGAYATVRGDAPAFASVLNLTVTGWIDVSSFTGTKGAFDRLVSMRMASGNNQMFDIGLRDNGIGVTFGGEKEVLSNAIDFAAGWVFFAVTRDSATGAVSIYVGDTDPTATLLLDRMGISGTGNQGNPAQLMIGNAPVGTHNRAGVVSYSDFRFYDEILDLSTLDEIRVSHLQPIPEPGTVALTQSALALTLGARRIRSQRKATV